MTASALRKVPGRQRNIGKTKCAFPALLFLGQECIRFAVLEIDQR